MTRVVENRRLYVPAFGSIYRAFDPIAYPVLRIMIGLLFVPHGMQKLFQMFGGRTIEQYSKGFSRMGEFWGSAGWVYYIGALEFVGGLCIALGLFTRFWAFQMAAFMAIAAFVANAPRGWFWTAGGSEAAFSWFIVLGYVCVYGGGRFSVDSAMKKEI